MLDTLTRSQGDKTLVVTKLNRLGRDASDVLATMKALRLLGCKVQVLQLGQLGLTSPAGKLMLTMLSAVAEMERDLLVERTQAGLARAKADGTKLGRPARLSREGTSNAARTLRDGMSVSAASRALGVSRQRLRLRPRHVP